MKTNEIKQYDIVKTKKDINQGMLYKYYDIYQIQKDMEQMNFEDEVLMYDKKSEKYVHIDFTENLFDNNVKIYNPKINYISSKTTAQSIVKEMVEYKYNGIHYDKEVKKVVEKSIPVGEIVYSPNVKAKYFYDKKNRLYINSFRPPEIYWETIKEEYTAADFVKNILPHHPQFNVLLNNLFNDNKEDITYFINWLVSAMTGRKNQTACIITGQEGSGKGLLMEYISYYFGKQNTLQASNELLTSQFNELMEDRVFINLNEITLNKNRELYEKLKSWITDPTYNLNVKGVKQLTKQNNINFLITTNNQTPIEVSMTDRRYNIFKTKDIDLKTIVDGDFFKNYEKSFEIFTLALKKIKPDFKMADTAIMNELKENIADSTTTKKELFLKNVKKCNVKKFEDYQDVFLENDYFKKEDNKINYEIFINDLELNKIENSIAIWAYKCFVDNSANLTQIGKDFNNYIGKPKETRIKGKKIKYRALKEV